MAERKRRWLGPALAAVILAALVLAALAGFVWVNTQPYTPHSAQRLYRRHQAAYDAVGEALLQAGEGSYWIGKFTCFPEEIAGELTETLWAGRWGSDWVCYLKLGIYNTPAVLFELYWEEFDSGDGVRSLIYQYLAYIPEADALTFSNENTEQVTPLTENWYLYVEIIP